MGCVWDIDADIIRIGQGGITKQLFRNSRIDDFLTEEYSMGISGSKGMGKTFVLKCKRLLSQNEGLLVLPRDSLLDTAGAIELSKSHIKLLCVYNNWVNLWISCISVFLLSEKEVRSKVYQTDFFDYLSPETIKIIDEPNVGIFSVLKKVLSLKNKRQLNQFIGEAPNLIELLKFTNLEIALYVDKLEEPFNTLNFNTEDNTFQVREGFKLSAWRNSQVAFAEAVYRLYSTLQHIKIFYGIRQEALNSAQELTTEHEKVIGRIKELQYSNTDLLDMFSLYVKNEKPENLISFSNSKVNNTPFEAFIGIKTVMHRTKIDETGWEYLLRHTLKRPRDIMSVCLNLYDNIICDSELRKNEASRLAKFRICVNSVARSMCEDYIRIQAPLMSDNIGFADDIISISKNFPTDIFNKDSIVMYCGNMNTSKGFDCRKDCQKCDNPHYFSILNNLGLLGHIRKSVNSGIYENKMNHIGSSVYIPNRSSLEYADIYYAHPAYSNIAKEERKTEGQEYIPSELILNGYKTNVDRDTIIKLKHQINNYLGNKNILNVFLSSTVMGIELLRNMITKTLENSGYVVFRNEGPGFLNKDNQEHNSTADKCIDKMIRECSSLIHIVSDTFGNKYHGDYLFYLDDEVKRFIKNPSISFMEFYIADKLKKEYRLFIDAKLYTAFSEWEQNKGNNGYKSSRVSDINVFKQISYIRHRSGSGVWLQTYNTTEELMDYINAYKPQISN
jgi:hypothetical protein